MTRFRWSVIASLILLAGCSSTRKGPESPVLSPGTEPAVPSPVATQTPTPSPVPTGPVPAPRPSSHLDPPLVRVLLERTQGSILLDQPGRAYRVMWGDQETWLWGPLSLQTVTSRAWQVGAFRDPAAASETERRLRQTLGPDVSTTSVPTEGGLLRVRVQWRSGEPPDPKTLLSRAGFADAFAVETGSTIRVESSNAASTNATSELVVRPQDGWPTAVGGRRYHGEIRFRVVGGDLLAINHLNLESYLKGVVPAEMGPSQFPQLDALKAQTVAARTYAIAHLGDHDLEGYDLCDTPACQVYKGADVQHGLTDRAVEETTGLIAVYDGKPIDAMYTSTCGGHTEDSSLLFSGRAQPYLVGVACAWERPMMIRGSEGGETFDDGTAFRTHLASRALALAENASPRSVLERVAALCEGRVSGIDDRPSPSAFATALLTAGGLEEATALVSRPGAGGLAELAGLFRFPLEVPAGDDVRVRGWHLRAALAVLQLQGRVVQDSGEAVPRPHGVGIFPRRADHGETIPEPVPLYWRWDDAHGSSQAIRVLPGTTLERYRQGEDVLALVVVQSAGGAEADRRSSWRSWVRDRSWSGIAQRVGIPDLERLEVTRRGQSGRVVGLAVIGRSGAREDLKGFPIRRALDLPENLFSFHVMTSSDGQRTVRFLGRGWGHGVGLCQNGAYGLARAGMTYDGILKHYYSGIEIVTWVHSDR